MTVECFLDTNVLVYAVSRRLSERAKRERALDLMEVANFGLSGQVLQEFYVTVTRKSKPQVTSETAGSWLNQFQYAPCIPTDWHLVMRGIGHAERHKISYWDGAIIAAAEELDAKILYTEDLNDGQAYGSVTVENPFRRLV